jgi:AcrR family transcriptional regulator
MLEAGDGLLDGRDPDAITLDEILAKAGTSASSFYQRFGSKDRFVDLLHERFCERTRRESLEWAEPSRWVERPLEDCGGEALLAYFRMRRDQAPALASLAIVEARHPHLAERRRRLNVEVIVAARRCLGCVRSRDGRAPIPERLDLGLEMVVSTMRAAIDGKTRARVVSPEDERRLAAELLQAAIGFLLGDPASSRGPEWD